MCVCVSQQWWVLPYSVRHWALQEATVTISGMKGAVQSILTGVDTSYPSTAQTTENLHNPHFTMLPQVSPQRVNGSWGDNSERKALHHRLPERVHSVPGIYIKNQLKQMNLFLLHNSIRGWQAYNEIVNGATWSRARNVNPIIVSGLKLKNTIFFLSMTSRRVLRNFSPNPRVLRSPIWDTAAVDWQRTLPLFQSFKTWLTRRLGNNINLQGFFFFAFRHLCFFFILKDHSTDLIYSEFSSRIKKSAL